MKKQSTEEKIYDLIIVGSGVAGLSAGLYAGRYRMATAVIGEPFGGETATAGVIGNYPGNPEVDGYDLVSTMRKQAEKFGTQVIDKKVTAIKRTEHCFEVTAKDQTFRAHEIILAGGTERRKLDIPREKELKGRGVHYCITCDGPLYGGKTIAIVGGGDASVKGVNLAAQYAKKIYLIIRGKEIIAEPINRDQLNSLGNKVEILLETEVIELNGEKKIEGIKLSKAYNNSTTLPVDAVFVEIGALPNTELAKMLGIDFDKREYIKVDTMMRTNIHGVFAAGDNVNFFGRFKQAITAAAMGAVAATSAFEDSKVHRDVCPYHIIPVPELKVKS